MQKKTKIIQTIMASVFIVVINRWITKRDTNHVD